MSELPPPPVPPAGRHEGWNPSRLGPLWPQLPLALILGLEGALNLLQGFKLPLAELARNREINELAQSLSALGGTAQIILGLMLLVAGVGLLWRLVSAWSLAVLLVSLTVAVNAAKANWGFSLGLAGLLLAGLLWYKDTFRRRTMLASVVFSLSSMLAILAYGVFGSFLLGKGFHPPIHDFNNALYFTIVSLSTVGYGDIVPVSPEARWFVMSLLVIGLGVFASAIASALGPKISGELNRLFNPGEKSMEPTEHVILVGDGALAVNTAAELHQRQVAFVQIMARPHTGSPPAHRVIVGDATTDEILRQAGVQTARLVIAARDEDGDNAFITLGVKAINPAAKVLAVAASAQSIPRLRLAGADQVFCPAAAGGRLVASLAHGDALPPEFSDLLADGPAQTPSGSVPKL